MKNKQTVEMFESSSFWDDLPPNVRAAFGCALEVWSVADAEAVIKFIEEETMTDQRIMKEYECGRKVGIEQEAARISTVLQDHAKYLFIAKKDELAKEYRSMAETILKKQE